MLDSPDIDGNTSAFSGPDGVIWYPKMYVDMAEKIDDSSYNALNFMNANSL